MKCPFLRPTPKTASSTRVGRKGVHPPPARVPEVPAPLHHIHTSRTCSRTWSAHGRREPFDRQKLRGSILRRARSAPSASQAWTTSWRHRGPAPRARREGDLESRLGDLVMENLRSSTQVAYVRFASVYRQFGHHHFMDEARGLRRTTGIPKPLSGPSKLRRREDHEVAPLSVAGVKGRLGPSIG